VTTSSRAAVGPAETLQRAPSRSRVSEAAGHEAGAGLGLACRSCGATDLDLVVDLGDQPPAERFIPASELSTPDRRLPLRIRVCRTCWLVQLEGDPVASADEPAGLAFSISTTMRNHVEGLVADAIQRLGGRRNARVLELASHGNRLHDFFAAGGLRSELVEPIAVHAASARDAGVPVIEGHLTPDLARRLVADGGPADLVVDAFHLAHEADPGEWANGVRAVLAPTGVAIVEFDHLRPIVDETQYDGFRHGHASYLSLTAFSDLLRRAGLTAVDARPTPAYGGSLRVVVAHEGARSAGADAGSQGLARVSAMLDAERTAGLADVATYRRFADRVEAAREGLRTFFESASAEGRAVAGYGAPSRGNTLLNSSGIGTAELPFVVDRAVSKHGQYLPGSRIPIRPPAALDELRPAYVLILAWDLADEIVSQLPAVRSWGGRFVVPLPTVRVLD
jgi:hypothetical protein